MRFEQRLQLKREGLLELPERLSNLLDFEAGLFDVNTELAESLQALDEAAYAVGLEVKVRLRELLGQHFLYDLDDLELQLPRLLTVDDPLEQ